MTESPRGSYAERKKRVKEKYRENIRPNEWRKVDRLDIMTGFGKYKPSIGL